jgi:CRP-like cAMP-binding protein
VVAINLEKHIDVILSTELFSSFSKTGLVELFNSSNYKVSHYGKGQIVHIQNELCESMDLILEGEVSVQKIDEDGNVFKVAVFSGGDILGANLLFSNSNSYPLTIVSESKTVVLHIFKELILDLSQKSPTFTAGLLTAISNKTLVLTDKIDAMSFKTIRQRIIDFLTYEYHVQGSSVIKLNMSKKELAERFGVQRTSLSRELNKMRKDGLIEFDPQTITIKDVKRFLTHQE